MDLIRTVQAIWIGHRIARAIAQPFVARIFGATSRGLFLSCPEGQILFISYETSPGPLSINLAPLPLMDRLHASLNQRVEVKPDLIRFSSGEQIRLSGASVWQPSPLPALRAGRAARLEALRTVAALASAVASQDSGPESLVPLLLQILELPGGPGPAWQQPVLRAWSALKGESSLGQPSTHEAIVGILGLGRGLTPTGDDFTCGLLLGLNRLAPAEQPAGTRNFSHGLVRAARLRTTALSAALIEAASLGSADQRLVSAWDGLLCGSSPPAQIVQQLATYGSSSGIDSLAGFAAASSLIKD